MSDGKSSSLRWERAKVLSTTVVAILLAVNAGALLGNALTPTFTTGPIGPGSFVSPCTYNVFTDGSGQFFARNCLTGAVESSSANALTLLQGIINTVNTAGGGTVYLNSGNYTIGGTLIIPGGVSNGGVILSGAGFVVGAGATITGTQIRNTAPNVPAIKVNGAYGFIIQNLAVIGNNNGDDGILLTSSGGAAPRSAYISRVYVGNAGRDCIRLEAYSYVVITNSQTQGCTNGIHITGSDSYLREFIHIVQFASQSASGSGILIDAQANEAAFDDVDVADANISVKIIDDGTNGLFDSVWTKLSIARPITYGIEIFANTQYINRNVFQFIDINMKGTSAAEKAIYVHRSGGYYVGFIEFNFVDIYKAGATQPTTSIDMSGAAYGDWTGRDSTTGLHVASVGGFHWTFLNSPKAGQSFITGTGAQKAFVINITTNSPYPGSLAFTVVVNHNGNFTIDYSNTQKGVLSITITFGEAPAGALSVKIQWMLETIT